MDLQPNKIDGIFLPITNNRISASEWNQLVGSCMAFITEAGLTPDASDNEQFLNAFKTIAAGLELVGANTNLSNLTATGEARFTTKANTDLSNVPASKGILTETYANGTSWYRVYSDGWCEQGSTSSGSSGGGTNITVTFLKPYKDTNYTIVGVKNDYDNSGVGLNLPVSKTTTYFSWSVAWNIELYRTLNWQACGYIR